MALDNIKKAEPRTVNTEISWVAPQIINAPRANSWYWIVSIVALVLAVVFFFMKNYLGIVVVVITPIVFYLMSQGKNPEIKYKIDQLGVMVGEKTYLYNNLKSYWIIDSYPYAVLYIETTKKLLPPLTIHLVNIDAEKVDNFIGQYLPHSKNKKSPISDNISKLMGF